MAQKAEVIESFISTTVSPESVNYHEALFCGTLAHAAEYDSQPTTAVRLTNSSSLQWRLWRAVAARHQSSQRCAQVGLHRVASAPRSCACLAWMLKGVSAFVLLVARSAVDAATGRLPDYISLLESGLSPIDSRPAHATVRPLRAGQSSASVDCQLVAKMSQLHDSLKL